jgi:hypothetical protein
MYDEVMMKLPGGDSVPVNVSASGPTTLVVGVAGKSILVVYGVLIGTAATSITIEDTDGTVYVGPMPFAANGGVVFPYTKVGVSKKLATGKGLVLGSSVATQVGGVISFVRLPA